VHEESSVYKLVCFGEIHPYLRRTLQFYIERPQDRRERGTLQRCVHGKALAVSKELMSKRNLEELERIGRLVVDQRKHFSVNATLQLPSESARHFV
jgi:hypothetical protein